MEAVSDSLPKKTLKVGGTLALLGAFLGLLHLTADVFLLAFLALLLAVGLRGAAAFLSAHTPIPTGWSLGLVSLVLLGSLLLLGLLTAPRLAGQVDELSGKAPEILRQAEASIRSHPLGEKVLASMRQAAPSLQDAGKHLTKAKRIFSRTFGALANVVILVALTVFLAMSPRMYLDPVIRLFPPRHRSRMREVLDQTGGALRMWLLGRILSMLIISVLTGLGLWWMGVPLALLLAVIAGLLNFIPNIGPVIALIPAVLLALPMGMTTVAMVLGLYTGVQFLESYIFTPIIQKKAVDVPPALLLFSQIIFGVLFGFLGLLLATPLMAVIIVLVRTLYVEDVLEAGRAAR